MGSRPWKDAFVRQVESAVGDRRVKVTTPGIVYREDSDGGLVPAGEKHVVGSFIGEGSKGSLRCLIFSTATSIEVAAWKALAPDERRASPFISLHERWIPIVRGMVVGEVRAPDERR
jgi:hypothetical protein